MQPAGLSVLLEGKNELGGGLRTAELTSPGFRHDILCGYHAARCSLRDVFGLAAAPLYQA